MHKVPFLTPNPAAFAAAKSAGPGPRAGVQTVSGGAPDQPQAAPGAAAPATVSTFDGQQENGWIPPDTQIAAGPNHIVEVTNSQWGAYNKDGSQARAVVDLMTYFANTGVPQNATALVFDPKAVFRGGHFYFTALYEDDTTQTSYLLLSASLTDQATGAWCNFAYQAKLTIGGSPAWADFDGLGVTANGIYVHANMFTFGTNPTFVGNELFIIDKSKVDACQVNGAPRYINFTNSDGSMGFSLRPVTDYDGATNVLYLVNAYYPGSGSANQFTIWRLTNPQPCCANLRFWRWTITTGSFSIPALAPQPGSTTGLDTSDTRLGEAFKRYGVIYVSHGTGGVTFSGCGGPSPSSIHWAAFNAPSTTDSAVAPTLQSDGYIGACNEAYFMPAMTVDGFGNSVLTFNRSSSTVTPELRFIGKFVQNTFTGVFANPSTLVFAGPTGVTETRGRWGDYSGISVDPSDQSKVWIAGQYTKNNDFWGTRIGQTTMGAFAPPGF